MHATASRGTDIAGSSRPKVPARRRAPRRPRARPPAGRKRRIVRPRFGGRKTAPIESRLASGLPIQSEASFMSRSPSSFRAPARPDLACSVDARTHKQPLFRHRRALREGEATSAPGRGRTRGIQSPNPSHVGGHEFRGAAYRRLVAGPQKQARARGDCRERSLGRASNTRAGGARDFSPISTSDKRTVRGSGCV